MKRIFIIFALFIILHVIIPLFAMAVSYPDFPNVLTKNKKETNHFDIFSGNQHSLIYSNS